MSMVITGFGTAVPEVRIAQAAAFDATQQLCCDSDDHRRVMKMIYQSAGVHERGTVLLDEPVESTTDTSRFFRPRSDIDDYGPTTRERMEKFEEHSLSLALRSAGIAIGEACLDVSQITHLVTVSCSGFQAPGFDVGLIQTLGLSPDSSRTHIGFMGCHGSFNALRVAKAFVEADANAVVLVCSVELCSLHHHYGWATDKVIANALFADGSAAVICRHADATRSAPARFQMVRSGSHLVSGTTGAMTWRIGDHGFEMTLSQKVPSLIERNLNAWMTSFLAREGLTIETISGWAIHPGGPKILDACLLALSLPENAVGVSREILSRYGNMSSATILFLLNEFKRESQRGPIVALGFGPGLTIEAMLLRA